MKKIKASTIIILLVIQGFVSQSFACTNFCMKTPKGPVFGSNLDLFFPADGYLFINKRNVAKSGFEPGTTGKVAQWTSKYGSVTFNLAGLEWAFGGMNEAGLVLGSMELITGKFSAPDERPPLPIGVWAQYILDTCSNLNDVIEATKQVRIQDQAAPIHYLISDAEGNSITIEWINGKLVYHIGENLPISALTNSSYDEALSCQKQGGPHWWESDRGDTNQRFTDAARRNSEFGISGETNAIKYAFETLTEVVAAAHTKWSIVYDIAERKIYYGSAVSPTLKYLSFNDLDFSCEAPTLMLDVNAQIEGDVRDAFQPYERDKNLVLLQNVCARVGIDLSQTDGENIMNRIESFECSERVN